MATSNITFYITDITPQRNCVVDDIENYLKHKSVLRIAPFQYQWIQPTMEVVINVSENIQTTMAFNYAVITQNSKNFYFFVDSLIPAGKTSVKVRLTLDTVQTFYEELRWSHKTQIIREHRPRFEETSTSSKLVRHFDHFNEGLNPVKTLKQYEAEVGDSHKWYLVYTSSNEITPSNTTDPVRILMLANYRLTLAAAVSGNTFSGKPELGVFWFVTGSDNSANTTTVTGNSTFNIGVDTFSGNDDAVLRAVRIQRYQSGTSSYAINITKYYYTGNSYPYTYYDSETNIVNDMNITINNTRFYHKVEISAYYRTLTDLSSIDALDVVDINSGTVPAVYSSTFAQLDRSNSRFTKIIEIPYQPLANFGTSYIDYGYKTYYLPLTDYTPTYTAGTVELASYFFITGTTPASGQDYDYTRESKLYNSEFLDLHLIYDNVSLPLKLENSYGFASVSSITMTITQYISNDMSGTKAFKIAFDGMDYNFDTDFENYMVSTRSTEKPIYTSGYADYIKTGYNYDQEAVKRANQMTAISSVLSGISGAVSMGGGTYATLSEGGAIGASLGSSLIAQGIGQVSNIIASVESVRSNNLSFANSLNQKLAASVNVSGQASTDLMDQYGGGKVRFIQRGMREELQKNIAKTLYLTGYSYPVQEEPDFTSRLYFNYVQCEPVFDDEGTAVYRNYLDDIRERFRNGVTVFHSVNGTYDFEQELENWETFLIS